MTSLHNLYIMTHSFIFVYTTRHYNKVSAKTTLHVGIHILTIHG